MRPITTIQERKEFQTQKLLPKILLICGILSSLLYAAADTLAAMQYKGYSYISQAHSELEAIGTPTRTFIVSLLIIYNILVIAFGVGICITDTRKRTRLTGIMLIGYTLTGFVTMIFFPMHMRGAGTSITDGMHAALTGIFLIFILLSMGIGATLHGKRFCLYSIITILILILFGVLAGADSPKIAANLPTPWLGIKERINIFALMLWILVLSISLLYPKKNEIWRI